MLKWMKSDIGVLLQKILFVLMVFFLLRVVFVFVNARYFSGLDGMQIVLSLFYAVKFDLAVVLPVNAAYLLIALIVPAYYACHRKFFSRIFFWVNFLLLFIAVCDNLYFSYTQHRVNYALLYLLPGSFTVKLVITYLIKGWYWILLLLTAGFIFRKTFSKQFLTYSGISLPGKLIGGLLILTACFYAVRGFEARPLSPSTTLLYFPPRIIDLVSNTGFNLLYSYYKGQKELPQPQYFSREELDKRFTIFQSLPGHSGPAKPNIVLFVMESFARDFLDSNSGFKASTPFLDSLMSKSTVFTNAFSNGNESTHGLVAILASLPPFTQIPYYHSQYHAASIHGLGSILGSMNYDCSFFLGDTDDSFGFRQFTHSLGIRHYYSRKDFGDDRFYNGAWGIHDDRFFRYAATVLSAKKRPFFATIFNVSSHPPYIIPEDLKSRFTIKGQNAAQNSISYVDYAYEQFFEKAKVEPWFSNTIFIFIADHFLSPSDNKQVNSVNMNEIPFFIYSPGLGPSTQNRLVQQLDIVPTILDLSGYRGSFMSFGKSVFDSTGNPYAVQRMGDIYQVLDDEFVLGFNPSDNRVVYFYNYLQDSMLKTNLVNNPEMAAQKAALELQLKARIQRYNGALLHNKLFN